MGRQETKRGDLKQEKGNLLEGKSRKREKGVLEGSVRNIENGREE